jgi:hypothetical protein
MHSNKKSENNIAPDARDFLGGNYLRKEDLSAPTTVTINAVRSVDVPNAVRRKLVVWFREITKPLILNKTNTRKMVELFRTTDTSQWKGTITIYIDENVHYGGQVVGGIRLRAATVSEPVNVPISVPIPVLNGLDALDLRDEADSFRGA